MDAAATVPLARIAQEPGADCTVPAAEQMRRQHLLDECGLRLSLDMEQQSAHRPGPSSPDSRVGRPPKWFFSHSWPRL